MPTFTVDDIIGRSFLLSSGQDSHKKTKAADTRKIEELDQDPANRGGHIKFLLKLNRQEDVEQVINYNHLLDYLEKEYEVMGNAYQSFKDVNRNMSKLKGWTLQSSLLMLWMDENSNQQSNKNC